MLFPLLWANRWQILSHLQLFMCAFSLLLPTVKAFCPSVPSKHIPTSGVASRDPLLGREIRDSTRVTGEAQPWHCVLEALVLMGPSKPEYLADEPKAFSSSTNSTRSYWWSNCETPCSAVLTPYLLSDVLHLTGKCLSCAGDTGGFSEDIVVFLSITNVI